jgi:hypothetical protein
VEVQNVGNKTWFSWFVQALAILVGVTVFAHGGDAKPGSARVTVSMYNNAGADRDLVLRAERTAQRIFRTAGVEVSWRNWQPDSNALEPARSMGDMPRFDVHLLPRPRTLTADIFGVAFLGDDGRGQQADVFYDQVTQFSSRPGQDRAVLLGAVIAHEIGHLLLGSHSHSGAGIMRGRWDDEALRLTAVGLVGFNVEQGERMRLRIASRHIDQTQDATAADATREWNAAVVTLLATLR